MADPRRALGDMGERLAEQHLLAKGYVIRERHARTRYGEIDIVAQHGETLAFVEVKTRRGRSKGSAAESLTIAKQRRLVALAEAYAQSHDDLPPEQRIDVIAVDLAQDGLLLSLQHIENAVSGS